MSITAKSRNGKATKSKKRSVRKVTFRGTFKTHPSTIHQSALAQFAKGVKAIGGVEVAKSLLNIRY